MKDVVTDVQNEDRLREAFKIFDKNNNGLIELDELKTIMTALGQNLNVAQLMVSNYFAFCKFSFICVLQATVRVLQYSAFL